MKFVSKIAMPHSADAVERVLAQAVEPLVLIDAVTGRWPAARWTFASLRALIGAERRVPVDFFHRAATQRHEIAWETDRMKRETKRSAALSTIARQFRRRN